MYLSSCVYFLVPCYLVRWVCWFSHILTDAELSLPDRRPLWTKVTALARSILAGNQANSRGAGLCKHLTANPKRLERSLEKSFSQQRTSQAVALTTHAMKPCWGGHNQTGRADTASVALNFKLCENAVAALYAGALRKLHPMKRIDTVRPVLFSGDALPM
jgi:hypothetical protein